MSDHELIFVRHGQTEWNAAARMQGQMDSKLTALGEEQAAINGELLARLKPVRLYASPLGRTRQTAGIISTVLKLNAQFDPRIMEWDCGEWSGHLRSEAVERWPDEWKALQDDRFNYRGPGAENYPDMIARSSPFLDEVLETNESPIAIVSHGLIGRIMIGTLLGHSEEEMLSFFQPNDVVFRVTIRGEERSVEHFVGGGEAIPGFGGFR